MEFRLGVRPRRFWYPASRESPSVFVRLLGAEFVRKTRRRPWVVSGSFFCVGKRDDSRRRIVQRDLWRIAQRGPILPGQRHLPGRILRLCQARRFCTRFFRGRVVSRLGAGGCERERCEADGQDHVLHFVRLVPFRFVLACAGLSRCVRRKISGHVIFVVEFYGI